MSVTVIKVGLDPKKTTQWRRSKDANGIVTTTATQFWKVVFSGPQNDPSQCYGATVGGQTVPSVGDGYFGSSTLKCNDVNPQADATSNLKIYNVQVSFTSNSTSGGSGKWDTQISFDGIPIQETTYYDLDGISITNSANQNFATQPNDTYYDTAVKVSFKTSTFNETGAEALRGFVNSGDVTLSISALSYTRTFPAKTLKLENFSASPVVNSGSLSYWSVALDMTYRPLITAPPHCFKAIDGSALSGSISTLEYDLIADMGYAYYDSSDVLTTFTAKINGQDVPTNAPCLLDGNGGDGRPSGAPGASDAIFLAFRQHDNGDFSTLFTGIS